MGHGSRLKGFQDDLKKVARVLRQEGQFAFVECAYLEITLPSILDTTERVIRMGAEKILILPYFLLKGLHTQKDIPRIVKQAQKIYANRAQIVLCPYLGYHEKIKDVIRKRIRQATWK